MLKSGIRFHVYLIIYAYRVEKSGSFRTFNFFFAHIFKFIFRYEFNQAEKIIL